MSKPKPGNRVKVHYTGTLHDGTVFDSSRNRDEPLVFEVGTDSIIPGFEDAIIAMSVGDKKSVTLPPEEAYGQHVPSLVQSIDRTHLPKELEPAIGMQLQIGESEDPTIVTIIKVDEKTVTLDANHPLAGQALTFDLELVEIL